MKLREGGTSVSHEVYVGKLVLYAVHLHDMHEKVSLWWSVQGGFVQSPGITREVHVIDSPTSPITKLGHVHFRTTAYHTELVPS